ncbi:MAG: TetR/AcrR family transcriptional regulator [Chloroflexi bacterium]|nr:MAG: TetR/AcrR family transcriptional regulator [Chloroflexota bacterium]
MAEARLDRTTILDAAERIADGDGASGLTMRRVGAEIGADPTAVYRHFRDKNELLAALADRLFGQMLEATDWSGSWQDRLRSTMRRGHELYRTHPGFANVLAESSDVSPNLIRIAENALNLLLDAGLSPADAALFFHVLTNTVVGTGLFHAANDDMFDATASDTLRREYAALPPDAFPACVATAPHLYHDPNEVFDLNIEILIAAIEARGQATTTTR